MGLPLGIGRLGGGVQKRPVKSKLFSLHNVPCWPLERDGPAGLFHELNMPKHEQSLTLKKADACFALANALTELHEVLIGVDARRPDALLWRTTQPR